MNEYLFDVLKKLNEEEVVYFDYNYKVKHRDELPDGTYTID